mmetsp:Transcript_31649/g.97838  ORF Transcript_31649/g.97838 Transcript_31649/m.97838 type:complete len:664 (-) Transcript_31649:657-2648(-)
MYRVVESVLCGSACWQAGCYMALAWVRARRVRASSIMRFVAAKRTSSSSACSRAALSRFVRNVLSATCSRSRCWRSFAAMFVSRSDCSTAWSLSRRLRSHSASFCARRSAFCLPRSISAHLRASIAPASCESSCAATLRSRSCRRRSSCACFFSARCASSFASRVTASCSSRFCCAAAFVAAASSRCSRARSFCSRARRRSASTKAARSAMVDLAVCFDARIFSRCASSHALCSALVSASFCRSCAMVIPSSAPLAAVFAMRSAMVACCSCWRLTKAAWAALISSMSCCLRCFSSSSCTATACSRRWLSSRATAASAFFAAATLSSAASVASRSSTRSSAARASRRRRSRSASAAASARHLSIATLSLRVRFRFSFSRRCRVARAASSPAMSSALRWATRRAFSASSAASIRAFHSRNSVSSRISCSLRRRAFSAASSRRLYRLNSRKSAAPVGFTSTRSCTAAIFSRTRAGLGRSVVTGRISASCRRRSSSSSCGSCNGRAVAENSLNGMRFSRSRFFWRVSASRVDAPRTPFLVSSTQRFSPSVHLTAILGNSSRWPTASSARTSAGGSAGFFLRAVPSSSRCWNPNSLKLGRGGDGAAPSSPPAGACGAVVPLAPVALKVSWPSTKLTPPGPVAAVVARERLPPVTDPAVAATPDAFSRK